MRIRLRRWIGAGPVGWLMAGAALLGAGGAGAAPFALREVGPGVFAAIDGPEHKAISNAGVVIGDDSVLVVDSFADPEAARALVAAIRAMTPKPIRYVVNTHHHLDHVAGDAVLREAGAVIIAHDNERAWVRTENLRLIGDRVTPEQRAFIQSLPLADVTTASALTVWLGSRRVEIRAAAGHTGGDLVVAVPDARVVFCGDLLWRRIVPNTIDASIGPWIETEKAFEAMPDAAATVFVPGHGELSSHDDVAAFRGFLSDLLSETTAAHGDGLRGQALVDHVLPRLRARYGDWWLFDVFAARAVMGTAAELDGVKRRPEPVN